MSTNGGIFRRNGHKVIGVYHHWDSYPTGLGETLRLAVQHFGDVDRMLHYLIDEHPAGWSTINGVDFSKPAGYCEAPRRLTKKGGGLTAAYLRYQKKPKCFCHGIRHEESNLLTNLKDAGEWAYVFTGNLMSVYALHTSVSVPVATVDITDDKPDWEHIECGAGFERCPHYAAHHFPALESTPSGRLGTRTYLGLRPLSIRDAYAFQIDGKVFKKGGSGYSSRVQRTFGHTLAVPLKPTRNAPIWIESLMRPDGVREDRPVHYQDGDETPYEGVTPLYPPTIQTATASLLVAAKAANPVESIRRFRD